MIGMIRSSNHWEWSIASLIASPPTERQQKQPLLARKAPWVRRSEARSCHLKTLFQMDTNVLELKAPMNTSSSRYRLIMMAKWCLKSQEELRERLSRDRSVNPNQQRHCSKPLMFTWTGASAESRGADISPSEADCWWLRSTCVELLPLRCSSLWSAGGRRALNLEGAARVRRRFQDLDFQAYASERASEAAHLFSSPGTWHRGDRRLHTGRRSWAAGRGGSPASRCCGGCRGGPCWGHWSGTSPLQTPSSARNTKHWRHSKRAVERHRWHEHPPCWGGSAARCE